MRTQEVLNKLQEDLEKLENKIMDGKLAETEKVSLLKLIAVLQNHQKTEDEE